MIARCLVVGAGGFLGAIARYAVGVWIESFWRRDFPLATFLVNVSGCFILGFFLTYIVDRPSISDVTRLARSVFSFRNVSLVKTTWP